MTNPSKRYQRQPGPSDQRRFLVLDEIDVLADKIRPQYRALVLLGSFASLRWGEAAGLGVEAMNLLGRTLTVERTLVEVEGEVSLSPPKTKGSARRIALPRFLVSELERHLVVRPPTEMGLFSLLPLECHCVARTSDVASGCPP